LTDHHAALTYSSYLALDEVLHAQRPRSDEHDEMLFIVIHQVYELWFKQLLHEFARAQQVLSNGETAHALHTLKRALTILKVVVAQIDVLETMTPRQFTSFRERLEASSGFQSAQFREVEAVLGRRDARVFKHYPPGEEHNRIEAAMSRPSLFDSFLTYLSLHDYDVPGKVLHRDVSAPADASPELQKVLLQV
jgi:tryptophan 2,3-dioxygenase